MSDGTNLGEATLVLLTVVTLLLSAAFLPVVDGFGDGGSVGGIGEELDGELPDGGGAGELGDSGAGGDEPGGGELGEVGSLSGGSSDESSLSVPPSESQIAGGRDSGESLNSGPLFVVESPEDTYWRQTAYTTYTGTGWEQSTDSQPIDEGVPNGERTRGSRDIEYRVTLLDESRSLPTAWQPESVRLTEESTDAEVLASSVGGIQADRPLPENTSYVAESSAPSRDPAVLRDASGADPRVIQETYTQLPAETPARVGDRTDEIVDGERTRYDQAAAVETWLKSNRGYSLETDIDTSEPIADQLLFEVDAAYCQHFATTMVAMLRSQDIPARYVVGYAGGQPVGDDEYLVTGDRAHAWVEVYFPETGWVRFDPTPGEEGDPSDGELAVDAPEPPYDISLNRSATVGADVSVAVTKNDSGVTGAPVYINDERVGWTDTNGEISTTLPFAEEITVSAREPGSETKYADESTSASGSERTVARISDSVAQLSTRMSLSGYQLAAQASLPGYQLAAPVIGELVPTILQSGGDSEPSSETYTAATDGTVTVGGDRTAGETALVSVNVDDVPIEDATIRFDGERVGTTNSDGLYELSLADVEPGDYTVSASREPVSAETEFTVDSPEADAEDSEPDPLAPNVSVEADGIALPGGSATATVSRDGEPIEGAPVRLDGTVVGHTDANGTVAISFPFANAVDVTASVDGFTGEQSVDGLYRNAIVVVAVAGGLILGTVELARRRGVTLNGIKRRLATLGRLLVDLPNRLTALLIRLAAGVEAGILGLWRRLTSLPALFSGSVAEILRRLDPRPLVMAAIAWLQSRLRRRRSTDTAAASHSNGTQRADSEDQRQIRAIWNTFVTLVRPPKLTTRTPGEIGRYAVDRGLPQRPVTYLTDLYRAIEYGRRSADDSRLQRARDALSTIRDQREDDE